MDPRRRGRGGDVSAMALPIASEAPATETPGPAGRARARGGRGADVAIGRAAELGGDEDVAGAATGDLQAFTRLEEMFQPKKGELSRNAFLGCAYQPPVPQPPAPQPRSAGRTATDRLRLRLRTAQYFQFWCEIPARATRYAAS